MMNIPFGRVPGMIAVRPLRESVASILNLTSQQLVGVGLARRILTLKRLSRWWTKSHVVHALELRRLQTLTYNFI
jgi:hypothetical protein